MTKQFPKTTTTTTTTEEVVRNAACEHIADFVNVHNGSVQANIVHPADNIRVENRERIVSIEAPFYNNSESRVSIELRDHTQTNTLVSIATVHHRQITFEFHNRCLVSRFSVRVCMGMGVCVNRVTKLPRECSFYFPPSPADGLDDAFSFISVAAHRYARVRMCADQTVKFFILQKNSHQIHVCFPRKTILIV